MKALVFLGRHHMELREEPAPRASNDDILVSVEASGICGSDMHGYHGRDPRRVPPLIMGHEICGRALSGNFSGQRVAINPQIACGVCDRCEEGKPNLCMNRQSVGVDRAGGFADIVSVPERNLVLIPSNVDPAIAALAEPAATALHAAALAGKAVGRPLNGVRSVVFGGGAIGLLSALWLKATGASDIVLIETNEQRRKIARLEGFEVLNPLEKLPSANSVDLVVDGVGGAKTREQSMQMLRPGGAVVHVGLLEPEGMLDFKRLTLAEISFLGSFTYTPREMREAVAGLASGALGHLTWIDRRPLSEGPAAFAGLSNAQISAPKVVLCPNH